MTKTEHALNALVSAIVEEQVPKWREMQKENDRLQEELEAHAWSVSPAMAQAKIEQLQADNARLAAELATVRRDTFLEVAKELRNGAFTPKSHRLAWARWCEGAAERAATDNKQ